MSSSWSEPPLPSSQQELTACSRCTLFANHNRCTINYDVVGRGVLLCTHQEVEREFGIHGSEYIICSTIHVCKEEVVRKVKHEVARRTCLLKTRAGCYFSVVLFVKPVQILVKAFEPVNTPQTSYGLSVAMNFSGDRLVPGDPLRFPPMSLSQIYMVAGQRATASLVLSGLNCANAIDMRTIFD